MPESSSTAARAEDTDYKRGKDFWGAVHTLLPPKLSELFTHNG